MLESQDLPAVPQGALGEETNFGQAVQNHPGRFGPLEGVKDQPRRFAQFEVGRVQECLLLIGREQALGWHQLEDFDVIVERPPMGGGACPKLWLGLRQGDVEALLALFRSLQQEAKRHGGFPGAWISL